MVACVCYGWYLCVIGDVYLRATDAHSHHTPFPAPQVRVWPAWMLAAPSNDIQPPLALTRSLPFRRPTV